MLRGGWVITLMDNDTDNSTLECEVRRSGIVSSIIHLHFLKNMVETITQLLIGNTRKKRGRSSLL